MDRLVAVLHANRTGERLGIDFQRDDSGLRPFDAKDSLKPRKDRVVRVIRSSGHDRTSYYANIPRISLKTFLRSDHPNSQLATAKRVLLRSVNEQTIFGVRHALF